MLLFSFIVVVTAGLLAVPVTMFCLEVVAGLTTQKAALPLKVDHRQRVAVLVPAHNESAGLRSTLEHIKPQLLAGDRLLVVADNCSDDTAAVSAAAGAETIVRIDPLKAAKGYALDFGFKHLNSDPPAIVIIVDADCTVAEGTIDRLAATCAMTHRPVQALNLMTAPDGSPIKYQVAEFAWRVKNWVRPSGLKALNLPCQLMGTGMAFPWDLSRQVNFADGSTVEDVKLGLELAKAGTPPLFCPSARVTSHFPWSIEGALSQRKRWEEGHVSMILAVVPRLLCEFILRGNLGLLALTLDLLVPPLSLLVLLVAGMFLVAGAAVILGCPPVALFISTACLVALTVAVFLAWLKHGRDVLPANRLILIAGYILEKLPLYRQLLSRRTDPLWIRTDRGGTRDVPVLPTARPTIDT